MKTGWIIFWLILFFPLGLFFVWTKSSWTKQAKWIATGIIGLFVLFSAVGHSTPNSSTTTSNQNSQVEATATPVAPTDTPAPTIDLAKVRADYKASATQVTIADIAKDPNYYKNLPITFTGTILNFVQDSSGNTSGANVSDPNDYSSFIQVVFSPFVEVQSINKGDTITVWGKGLGSYSGKNAFGGTINEGATQEVYMSDTTSGYVDELDHNPSSR